MKDTKTEQQHPGHVMYDISQHIRPKHIIIIILLIQYIAEILYLVPDVPFLHLAPYVTPTQSVCLDEL